MPNYEEKDARRPQATKMRWGAKNEVKKALSYLEPITIESERVKELMCWLYNSSFLFLI